MGRWYRLCRNELCLLFHEKILQLLFPLVIVLFIPSCSISILLHCLTVSLLDLVLEAFILFFRHPSFLAWPFHQGYCFMLPPLFSCVTVLSLKAAREADDLFLDVWKGFFEMESLDPAKQLRISVGESAAWAGDQQCWWSVSLYLMLQRQWTRWHRANGRYELDWAHNHRLWFPLLLTVFNLSVVSLY